MTMEEPKLLRGPIGWRWNKETFRAEYFFLGVSTGSVDGKLLYLKDQVTDPEWLRQLRTHFGIR